MARIGSAASITASLVDHRAQRSSGAGRVSASGRLKVKDSRRHRDGRGRGKPFVAPFQGYFCRCDLLARHAVFCDGAPTG